MAEKSRSEIAFEIGYEQDAFASKEIAKLPDTLSKDNCSLFIDVFENIQRKSQECYNKAKEYGDDVLEYGADRLLVPSGYGLKWITKNHPDYHCYETGDFSNMQKENKQ